MFQLTKPQFNRTSLLIRMVTHMEEWRADRLLPCSSKEMSNSIMLSEVDFDAGAGVAQGNASIEPMTA